MMTVNMQGGIHSLTGISEPLLEDAGFSAYFLSVWFFCYKIYVKIGAIFRRTWY
jgi:hypothetical protein